MPSVLHCLTVPAEQNFALGTQARALHVPDTQTCPEFEQSTPPA
jgi:hypothetical protein